MKISEIIPPREFATGRQVAITVRHCANIELAPDEQVTFLSEGGSEYDVVRKSWGYYATPSLNGRLRNHGLRAALMENSLGKAFLLLVENGREQELGEYMASEEQRLLCWLDSDEAVERLKSSLGLPEK